MVTKTTPFSPQQDFDVGALYAGNYLKADDLDGKTYTAIIVGVETVEIAQTDGSVHRKAAVTLQGWPAKLVLNKTNSAVVVAAYGRRSGGLINRPLEVYPDTTLFNGRPVQCIRVRIPRPTASATAFPGSALVAPAPAAMAPAAAPSAQGAMLPPIATAADVTDDLPY